MNKKTQLLVFFICLGLQLSVSKVLFYTCEDERHLGPLLAIAKEYQKNSPDTSATVYTSSGNRFNAFDNYNVKEPLSICKNNSRSNNFLSAVPGFSGLFAYTDSDYQCFNSVLKEETNVTLLVVDILSFGAVSIASKNGIPLIRSSPFPYTDFDNDPFWMEPVFLTMEYPFLVKQLFSSVVRSFQKLALNLHFLQYGGHQWGHPTLVHSIVGYDIPRSLPPNIFYVGLIDTEQPTMDIPDIHVEKLVAVDLNIPSQKLSEVEKLFNLFCKENPGVGFIARGSNSIDHSPCIIYQKNFSSSVYGLEQVIGSIVNANHLKVHRSLIHGKPVIAIATISMEVETMKRINRLEAGVAIWQDSFLQNYGSFNKTLQRILQNDFLDGAHKLQKIFSLWGSGGSRKAAEIIQNAEIGGLQHMEPVFQLDSQLLIMSIITILILKYVNK